MKNLRVTLVQTDLVWENSVRNIELIEERISGIGRSTTDLIILPEMFNTGFTMNASQVAEKMPGLTIAVMKLMARDKNAVVCGSVIIEEKGKYFNRLIWMPPKGAYSFYDKRHLFRMANEHKTFTAGTNRLIVELKGWKICPLVCYDLRFPVWSRSRGDIDLLLYVANWPSRRRYAWKQLLIARAIENQCYVAGVNRTGKDGNGIEYAGDSVVLDALGKKLSKTAVNKISIETVVLNYKELAVFRKQFPVMLDADDFTISKVVQ